MIILETERLRLEELEERHFEDLAELLANERVHRLWPEPKTKDRDGSWEFFERMRNMYNEHGYSFWAVIRKEDDQFLGLCGLLPETYKGTSEVEVAYRMNDRYWGKGYAPEAALGCMNYAHEKLGWSTIISLILPENEQSIRVAEKNGLTPDGHKIHCGMNHIIYRKQWQL